MNGDVSVRSEVGKGSTFTIHVQLSRFEKSDGNVDLGDEYAAALQQDYRLDGCHVLVAEDNALNRTILGAMLTNEGMTFAEAKDGEEAVAAFVDAPAGTFDCILMDMRMPRLDGIRATAQIRASNKEDAKTIPIVGVSSNGFVDDIRQAHEAGIDVYTTKPIERETLFLEMSRLIHKR